MFPVIIRHLPRRKKKKFPEHFWMWKILVCCSSQPEAEARSLCPGTLPSRWRWGGWPFPSQTHLTRGCCPHSLRFHYLKWKPQARLPGRAELSEPSRSAIWVDAAIQTQRHHTVPSCGAQTGRREPASPLSPISFPHSGQDFCALRWLSALSVPSV